MKSTTSKLSFLFALTVFVLFSLVPGHVLAQTMESKSEAQEPMTAPDVMIGIPNPGTKFTPFLGQNHFYSYTFRGNGEAVVTAKIVLTNKSESEPLTQMSLGLPFKTPSDLTAYQIIGTGQCIRYDTPGFDQGRGGYYPPKCLEYSEPDYFSYWGDSKYQKADVSFSGDTLTVKLPTQIEAQKSGAFFVYFRTLEATSKKSFGSYKYEIETFKVDDQINQVTIGVNTDTDLYIKGGQGEVDYGFAEADVASLKMAGGSASASPAIDAFIQNVGYGKITKSASNLAPLESYAFDGVYAKSRIGLYAKEAGIAMLVILGFILITVFVVGGVIKSLRGQKSEKKTDGEFVLSLGISFVGASSIGIYTVFLMVAGQLLTGMGYQYQQMVTLFLLVISFCVYSALLFAPGVFWGFKKGLGHGAAVIGMTIMWLVFFFIIAVVLLFAFGRESGGFYPMPMLREISN